MKPVAPARASWTTEIWPTKPVMTTSDSAISAPISDLIERLPEVERQDDQRDGADDGDDRQGHGEQPLRPRHRGQPLLDQLTAARASLRRAGTSPR